MKSIVLDTNIAVDILNGREDVKRTTQAFDTIFLPVIVSGELLFGAKNSRKSEENLKHFRQFISLCEELPINGIIAEEYADIRIELKQKGKPIPENDIWIAAICSVNDLPLMTRDQHFDYIDGLHLVRI